MHSSVDKSVRAMELLVLSLENVAVRVKSGGPTPPPPPTLPPRLRAIADRLEKLG